MKFRKTLFTSFALVAVFATTSCNGANKISFKEAVEYAVEHFDSHALDTIKADDTFVINSITVNGMVNLTNTTSGTHHKYDVNAGVKGITFNLPNVFATPISSNLITKIGTTYNGIAEAFSLISDNHPTTLNYSINNGGLSLDLVTNAGSKIMDTIKSLNTAMNFDHYAIQKILGVPKAGSTYTNDDYDEWVDYISEGTSNIFGQQTTVGMFASIIAEYIADAVVKVMKTLSSSIYSNFHVGIDDSSNTNNDKFGIALQTNKNGFLTDASFVLKSDVNLLASAADSAWTLYSYVADASLSFNVDLSFKSNIK